MKHLFIVRHGVYHKEGLDLTPRGIAQIQKLAKEMKAITGGISRGHYLVSSSARRAEQSAQIIADAFGLKSFETKKNLWTNSWDDFYPELLNEIDEIVESHRDTHEIMTLVTHYEVVNSYPSYASKWLIGREEKIRKILKGRAVHFNLENRTYQIIPNR